jgi:hypothetical protein
VRDDTPKAGRLRAIATSKPAIVGLVLLLIYAIGGFLLAPWLIRQQLPSLIDKHLGAQGSVSAVRINPFLLTFEATGLTITEKNGTPALQVGRMFIDFEASSLLRRAWTFREIQIDRPVVNADLDANESLNLARLLTPVQTDAAPAAQPAAASTQLPQVLLQHFVISGGVFSFTDHTVQPTARAQFNPVHFEMQDVSTLPDHRGEQVLTARLPGGGSLQWQGKFTLAPIDSSGTIALKDAKLATLWRFVQDHLTIAEPAGSYELGLHYRLRYGNGALDLQAGALSFRMKDVAIVQQKGGATLGKLAMIAFEDGSFDLRQRSLVFKDARIADGAINVTLDQDGKPDWAKLVRSAPADARPAVVEAARPAADKAAAPAPWQVALPKISIGPLALAVEDRSRVKPLHVTIASAQAGFGVAATVGNELQVIVDSGALKIGDVRIRSGDDKQPLITLAAAEIADGAFDLQQKTARAGRLRLSGGNTRVTREADGSLDLAGAFAARRDEPPRDSGFSITLDQAEVTGHSIALADRSFQPAVAYDLENVRVAVSKFALPFKDASPVELALRIKQGGALQAKGTLDLLRQTADMRFEATDIALAPIESVLKRHTTLTLASGKAGASGRVTWDGKSKPAAIRFAGAAAITNVDLKTEGSGERLFSWQRLAATRIDFNSADNRLAVAQLNLAQPYARLIVTKDRSTNLAGIMRPSAEPAAAAAPASKAARPLVISLERVSVERGAMDFSDLSLVLPFATHIKALGGSASGLSSAPDSRASLKFEGRVEDYGLARAEGTIQPFAPKKFTDIAVTFRNIALTPLSPYTATFAGRKIASGKLSLDLQYKLDNGQLAGENKIVLEQFTLGERVNSPSAVDLPLDLAVALLTDSDGKIELAVPVSGNVDHPEFSYGSIVWGAIRKVIASIVTAPFRALAALFGGNAETLSDIVFDPGSARILPTEYEKLRRVADGLQKRPQLKLMVQGLYHKENDGRALRTHAVRADLAAREGLKLAKGEDPGPVSFDSPKVQRALENMLGERAGGDAVAQFVDAFRKTAGREVSRVNPVLAMIGRGAGDRALYEALYQRLIELRELPSSALAELATARADAITSAFTNRLKFDPARLGRKPAEAVDDAANNGVPVKLSFEPVK